MNEILQIIGSIASIASIPLAVFIYLRQKEANYRKLRQEITKTLSYKIGEDSNITLFEVSSVIEAKARDFGVNPTLVPPDGIIEDLVAETISNPMLDSSRKHRVVENLQFIHTAGLCFRILSAYSGPLSHALSKVTANLEMRPDDREELQRKETEELQRRISKPTPAFEILSTTFGVIAAIISILSFVIGTTTIQNMVTWFQTKPQLLSLLLGVFSSLIAALLTGLISAKKAKTRKKLMEEKNRMQQGNCQQGAAPDAEEPRR